MSSTTCLCDIDAGDFSFTNESLSAHLNGAKDMVPNLDVQKEVLKILKQDDIRMHQFSGSVNGLPLQSLKLYSKSYDTGTKGRYSREFFGKLGNQDINYRFSAELADETVLRCKISFFGSDYSEQDEIEYSYDVANQWLIASSPDITNVPDTKANAITLPQAMLALNAGGLTIPLTLKQYIACVMSIVVRVGGVCAWLFLGCASGPGGCAAIIPAYIACVGPAVAASIYGCAELYL